MKTEIEYVAYHRVYHRVKRVFLPITDIEVYESEGQNLKLIAK